MSRHSSRHVKASTIGHGRPRSIGAGLAVLTLAGGAVVGFSLDATASSSTASRPLLDDATAAGYTKATYLGSWTPPTVSTPASATITVSKSGSIKTVQAGIDAAVAKGGTARISVSVAPGTYRELVCVPASAPPITLYGTGVDASATTIVFDNANLTPKSATATVTKCNTRSGQTTVGTTASATFSAYSNDFQAANLTFSNDYVEGTFAGANQSAVALAARGDRQVYSNIRALGNQDTLMTFTSAAATTAHQYFDKAYVEGDTDYVFGRSTAVFDSATFKTLTKRKSNGVVFAPSTAASNRFGYLVVNSTITSDGGTSGTVFLARAWDEGVASLSAYQNGASPNGQLVVRETSVDASIKKAAPYAASTASRPYCSSSCTNSANRFFEYANTGPGSAA